MKLPLPALSLGLRGRLILLLLAAIAALSGVIVWYVLDHRDERLQGAANQLLSDVKVIAARQQAIVARADAVLSGLLLRPDLRPDAAAEGCPRAFAAMLASEAGFSQMGVVLPDGMIACAAVPPQGRVSVADRNWFQQALRSQAMVVSEVLTGSILGKPVMIFGKARHDAAGRVAAVFFVSLDMAWLQRELAATELPESARLLLVGANGVVVGRHPDPEGWAGRNIAQLSVFQRIQAHGGAGVIEDIGPDRVPRLYAFAPLDPAAVRMTLWLALPRATVVAPAQRQLWLGLAIALAVLGATLWLTVWGSNRWLLQPLRALARMAHHISAGELGARSGLPHTANEIGQLAQALDESAAAGAELHRLERQNALILDAVGEGIFGLDREGRATFINPAGAAMLQWTAAELVGQAMHALHHHTRADGTPYPGDACPIFAACRDGAVHRVTDEVFWRKDGTSFPVDYVSTPMRDQRGKLAGAVVSFRDVTERKAKDAQAAAQIDELSRWHGATLDRELRILELKHEVNQLLGRSGQPPRYPSAESQDP